MIGSSMTVGGISRAPGFCGYFSSGGYDILVWSRTTENKYGISALPPRPPRHPAGAVVPEEFRRLRARRRRGTRRAQAGRRPTGARETAFTFSNASGGVIVIGVEPNGTIVGVSQPGEPRSGSSPSVAGHREPRPLRRHELLVGEATVLVVSNSPGGRGLRSRPRGEPCSPRDGASNTALVGADLSRFLQQRTFERFEVTPTVAPWEQAEPSLVARLAEAFTWDVDGDLADRCLEAGYVVDEGRRLMLTVAGATSPPARSSGRLRSCVHRHQTLRSRRSRPGQDLGKSVGPADRQVRAATGDRRRRTRFRQRDRRKQTESEMPKIPGARRSAKPSRNAVAHRTYEHAGAAVRIELRPSQVSIVSPGNCRSL